MNYNDVDSLRLLTRERHERRVREAAAEGLVRETRVGAPGRRRLRVTIGAALGVSQRLRPSTVRAPER